MPSSFSASKSDRFSESRELVHRVISAYTDVCSLPHVSTFALQGDGLVKSQRILTPGSLGLHFKCDVERVTERELTKPALQETWWDIAEGRTPKGLAEVHLVRKLQKAYRAIDPWKYFRPTLHRGSVASQQRAA
jgi:hypothetical protein